MRKLTIEQLKGMNKKQLYDYCRANKIKGYSNQNKAYINNLILQSYKPVKRCDLCEFYDIGLCFVEDMDIYDPIIITDITNVCEKYNRIFEIIDDLIIKIIELNKG